MARAQVHLRIRGRVQGVFFRATACDRARELGLGGWVRNRPDGSVEAVACGERDAVEAFVDWCHQGPPAARVDEVEVTWQAPACDGPFTVRYD